MKLPAYQDLSKEQDTVANLPLKGSYLVVGPPGTGKTVLALYRARLLKKKTSSVTVLMFSRLLSQYTSSAVAELGIGGTASTFHSWFSKLYHKLYRKRAPQIDNFLYDWTEVLTRVNQSPEAQNHVAYLIIDEGQDLPKLFYPVAKHLAEHLTIFADENQRLNDDNSRIDEIKTYSGIDRVHLLTRNYRNTLEIGRLASHFYTGLPTGIPALPSRRGDTPVMTRYQDLKASVEAILRFEHNNTHLEIGVLTPTKDMQLRFVNRLRGETRSPVEYYVGGLGAEAAVLSFGKPGIKVINYQSAKGLEFDAVFVPELQEVSGDPTDPVLRMRFYVLLSRARDQLYLGYSGNDEPRILRMFPKDLLEWR